MDYTTSNYHGNTMIEASQQSIVSNTFLYLGLSLLTVFGIATWGQTAREYNGLGMIVAGLGGLALVFIISRYWQKMSYQVLMLIYIGFVALEGYWLSGILMQYESAIITQALIITAGTFLVMSIIGYQTNINLLQRGNMLQYALLGLIVAWFGLTIASMFGVVQGLSFFGFILSIIGVMIFCAFIIYDINLLKELAKTGDRRVEIVMAMSIYLTVINLFLNILRILGYVSGDD